jgi:hypothetical protein
MSSKKDRSAKYEEEFKGVQRVITKLQRLVNSSKVSRRELAELESNVGFRIKKQVNGVSELTELLLSRHKNSIEVEQFSLRVFTLLSSIAKNCGKGYTRLLNGSGNINGLRLKELFNFDEEVANSLLNLREGLKKINRRKRISSEHVKQLIEIIDDIENILEERKKSLSKNKVRG